MDSTKFEHISASSSSWYQTLITALIFCIVEQLSFWWLHLIIAHRFSIGFMSGEFPGHSIERFSTYRPSIENLWAIIKRGLQKEDCSTMQKMISAVIKGWYHDEKLAEMCSNLVESMPNRVKMACKSEERANFLLNISNLIPLTCIFFNKLQFNK